MGEPVEGEGRCPTSAVMLTRHEDSITFEVTPPDLDLAQPRRLPLMRRGISLRSGLLHLPRAAYRLHTRCQP